MAKKDLTYGVNAIRGLLRRLNQPETLGETFAQLILEEARKNAARRPTPQAPMAARNLKADRLNIVPSAGGAPAAVAIGSEFGSTIYRQFQKPPNPRGYWLYPATRGDTVLKAMDAKLEAVLDAAVKGSSGG